MPRPPLGEAPGRGSRKRLLWPLLSRGLVSPLERLRCAAAQLLRGKRRVIQPSVTIHRERRPRTLRVSSTGYMTSGGASMCACVRVHMLTCVCVCVSMPRICDPAWYLPQLSVRRDGSDVTGPLERQRALLSDQLQGPQAQALRARLHNWRRFARRSLLSDAPSRPGRWPYVLDWLFPFSSEAREATALVRALNKSRRRASEKGGPARFRPPSVPLPPPLSPSRVAQC